MGKHFKVSSSIEWRSGENLILRPMECLSQTSAKKEGGYHE